MTYAPSQRQNVSHLNDMQSQFSVINELRTITSFKKEVKLNNIPPSPSHVHLCGTYISFIHLEFIKRYGI